MMTAHTAPSNYVAAMIAAHPDIFKPAYTEAWGDTFEFTENI